MAQPQALTKWVHGFVVASVVTAAAIGWAQTPTSSPVADLNEMYQAALDAVKTKKWDEARRLLEQIIEINPDFAPAYLFLGEVEEQTQQSPQDIQWLYEQALERDPHLPEANFRLCRILSQQGRINDALEACHREYTRDSRHRASRLLLGWLYLFGRSEPQQAKEWFEGLLAEGFDHPSVLFGEGMACAMTGERGRALEIVTRLKALGREEWASQLEQTLRMSSETPADWSLSLPQQPKASGQLVPAQETTDKTPSPSVTPPSQRPFPFGITPIRLKGKIVPLPPDYKDSPAAD